MGIFGGANAKVKAAPTAIRREKVVVQQKPKPRPATSTTSSAARSLAPPPNGYARSKSGSPYPSSADERSRKRKAIISTPRDSPAFDDDSSDDGAEDDDPFSSVHHNKRLRANGLKTDVNRKLRHKKAFGDEVREPRIVHGADVASTKNNCPPIFGAKEDEVAVELQYPSNSKPEKYELVWRKDYLNSVKDIIEVVQHVGHTYVTGADATPFIDLNGGFHRQLERSSSDNFGNVADFKAAVKGYNARLLDLVKNGTIAKNLDQLHHLPPSLVTFILTQVYDRIVAPKVDNLKKYTMGSDNVYGELMHDFVHRILVEQAQMTSDQIFVDLGSGVGNVVLQAALEVGCSSYGFEMMENACDLAEEQEREFRNRCLLWGIAPGRVSLERGDFTKSEKVPQVLKKADVVLVNNKAFTSTLNDHLVSMFLDLKPGCKIISLKNFVHDNKAAANSVANNILEVEQFRYHEGWVSWGAAGGDYFVSTKK
ncbi:histone-lysine N-methyltransferase, H3 lysine-79 specific [Microdochium trichocladiopsis]|uniref:Histone-lysine N-methyltransferase, H3 lysine-79 specific n=1 Tax=Microdochium trichocladiopsis TaxID=1682393 RepID=A0A9P8YEX4_9PEZI|nr:histone-lysine N-methyltransferase, H3 lysine-79 specific [Microdochium trichocladiopsis]KAH7037657.1 histone-lysine N-methyltransferase, H3 lysine-79 specific [Microdochium trichocladiopsis]